MIIGHGLKDFGLKESFVVSLGGSISADTIDSVREAFEDHWAQSAAIKQD